MNEQWRPDPVDRRKIPKAGLELNGYEVMCLLEDLSAAGADWPAFTEIDLGVFADDLPKVRFSLRLEEPRF